MLRTPKAPAAEASAIAEEYRDVLKPFADIDELHDALQQMNANKTGRTIALEHLLNLPRRYLSGFLTITHLVFAGEAPEQVNQARDSQPAACARTTPQVPPCDAARVILPSC